MRICWREGYKHSSYKSNAAYKTEWDHNYISCHCHIEACLKRRRKEKIKRREEEKIWKHALIPRGEEFSRQLEDWGKCHLQGEKSKILST